MKVTRLLFVFGVLIFLFNSSCSYAIRYDGTYSGKVVEADTGKPIEGVIVLGTWYAVAHTVAGGVHSYYDAQETATNKNGEFSIPGMGLRIMSNLEPMDILIFKSGYEPLGSMQWKSLKVDILVSKKIKWAGDKPIIPLKKLAMEERKKLGPPSRPSIPIEKMKLLTGEINKERIELGLTPFELGGNNR